MAEIPRSLLNELTDEINALSGMAQRQAGDALTRLVADWEASGNGDIAALREAAYEVIETACGYYADTVAAGRAAEFYDAVRKAQEAPGKYAAVAESLRDPQATYGSVKAFMASVVKQGATDMFVAACVRRLDAEIRKAANMCVAHNVSKDPAKPRYARVPSGETCGFCLMLSSFGFNYKTKEAASHSHPKCDCRVVPSFGRGSKVKGYDPDGMYDRFNECLDTLGGRNGLWAEWDAMPDAEREAYIKTHGNKAGKAFDAWSRRSNCAIRSGTHRENIPASSLRTPL